MLTQKSPNASWGVALPDEVDDGGRGCPYGYEYDTSVFTSTVASEWNLVCDRNVLQPLFQMVASSGTIVANLISGSVADFYGRRVPINIGAILNVASAIIIIFSGHYWIALVGRFLFGFSTGFVIWPTFNMAIEETPPKYRSLMGMLLGIPFSVWVVAMSGVAYLIRDWRNLQAAVSAPVLLFIPCLLFLDESPRWLMQNDRREEAVRVLQKAARLHKAEIPSPGAIKALADEMFQATKKRKLSPNTPSVNWMVDLKQGILQFVRTPAMRTITLLMPIVWFMQNLSYTGILLNANNFSSENPFVYVAMNSAIEILAILLFTPLTFRFGRRIVTTLGFLLAGLCLLAVVFIPEGDFSRFKLYQLQSPQLEVYSIHCHNSTAHRTRYLQICGFFSGYLLLWDSQLPPVSSRRNHKRSSLSSHFDQQVNLVYISELFPTTLRGRGVSLCTLVGDLGMLVAPFIVKFLYSKRVYTKVTSKLKGIGETCWCERGSPIWRVKMHRTQPFSKYATRTSTELELRWCDWVSSNPWCPQWSLLTFV
ncbi:solute carrier family 22 member 20-like [Oratosquilla oratoria]|uniref:solute carrier family 22 member 20-like n=1 Tax=Oratosquilla oratoria TaxID=337810 RepID=UPI003F75D5DC